MSIQAISTKIISTLGNKESLIPIIIKDGVDSTCLTYKSFKEGGKVEGIDRAVDEFGTQAIWIGGIPFYKKLYEWTAYKFAKLNPAVDPRIIADKEYSSWALNNAKGIMNNSKTQSVKDALTDCLKDGGEKAKKLFKGKIAIATALTLGTFFLLTKAKQANTKFTVLDDMKKEMKSTFNTTPQVDSSVFSEFDIFTKAVSTPSFKGSSTFAKNLSDAIMFNPVHNMKIIDAGITTERLACSRNATEFAEHAIKEGSFLFFLYKFGGMIENGINKFSANKLKTPIDLAIDVLMDKDFENALKNGTIKSDIAKLPKGTSLTEKLDFIVKNPDNIIVQSAKKANIVATVKDKAGTKHVDTSKFIDVKQIDDLASNLLKFNEEFNLSGKTAKTFINKAKGLKVLSVAANIGISCFILGYLIPKAVYKYREIKTGTTKFHVAEDIKDNSKKEIKQ